MYRSVTSGIFAFAIIAKAFSVRSDHQKHKDISKENELGNRTHKISLTINHDTLPSPKHAVGRPTVHFSRCKM